MASDKTMDRGVRLTAPTYMRPRRSVLDDPLDIDAGKRVVLPPAAPELSKEMDIDSNPAAQETPVITDVTPDLAAVVSEPLPSAESPVDEVGQTPTEEAPIPDVAFTQNPEPVDAPAPDAVVENPSKRKGMSVFQQFIVLLLLLVVAAFLMTIYLYTNGWIELPAVVLNLVEKGLSLIP
jgi:hypothetical protein